MTDANNSIAIGDEVILSAVQRILQRSTKVDGGSPEDARIEQTTTPRYVDGGTP